MDKHEMQELTEAHAAMKGIITGAANFEDMTFSGKMVARFLMNNTEKSVMDGREAEREELVCRLLASGMTVEEISVILNIRIENVRIMESNNAKILIPEYVKTLKSRRKYREKSQR